MQNKKYQLKPALILCGAAAAFILVISVMAGNVNRNVAKNMKGRLLYDEVSPDQTSAVMLYDFESQKSVDISRAAGFADARNAVFAGENRVAFTAKEGAQNGVYIYDLEKKQSRTVAASDNIRFFDLDYCAQTDRFVCLCGDGEDMWIEEMTADGEKLAAEPLFAAERIDALSYNESGDGVYFVHKNNSGGGVLKLVSSKDSRLTTLCVSETTLFTGIAVWKDTILLCERDEESRMIGKYDARRGRVNALEFNAKEYACAAAVPVSATQFLVSADVGGSFAVYVCNGSNMVKVEGIDSERDLMVSDYCPQ